MAAHVVWTFSSLFLISSLVLMVAEIGAQNSDCYYWCRKSCLDNKSSKVVNTAYCCGETISEIVSKKCEEIDPSLETFPKEKACPPIGASPCAGSKGTISSLITLLHKPPKCLQDKDCETGKGCCYDPCLVYSVCKTLV